MIQLSEKVHLRHCEAITIAMESFALLIEGTLFVFFTSLFMAKLLGCTSFVFNRGTDFIQHLQLRSISFYLKHAISNSYPVELLFIVTNSGILSASLLYIV